MFQMSESIVIVGGTGHLGKEVALLYPSAKIYGRDLDLGSRRECEDKLGKFDTCIFLAADPRLHFYKDRPYECVNANYALIDIKHSNVEGETLSIWFDREVIVID